MSRFPSCLRTLILTTVFLLFVSSGPVRASDSSIFRAQRLAAAAAMNSFGPFYSIREGTETDLFLLNTTADPVSVDAFVRNPTGEEISLGRYVIGGAEHLELALKELLRGTPAAFAEGSIRLSYLGDKDTLPGWAVLRSGSQALEIALSTPEEFGAQSFLSFWDTSLPAPGPPPRAQFYLVNTGASPVAFSAVTGNGRRSEEPLRGRLLPGERHVITLEGSAKKAGWIRVTHDGQPGDLYGVGLLDRGTTVTALPLFKPEETSKGPDFEAIRIPLPTESRARAATQVGLSFFNTGIQEQLLRLEVLAQASGAVLATDSLSIGPYEVASFDAGRILRRLSPSSASQELRLRVRGGQPSLLVRGASVLPTGETVDLTFFPAVDAHHAGTYPIPPPDRYEVFTSLVNLGAEDAKVVVQTYWRGGTYSYGPVTVPGGGSSRISLDEITALEQPDMLQRRFDRNHPRGVLKWLVQSGSLALLGRTEVRPRDSGEAFGFNCFGCCQEIPRAGVEPGFVDFVSGETPLFQACIFFDTCSGTMGPYEPSYVTSTTIPYPFSWNLTNVSASGPAEEDLWFESSELAFTVGCRSEPRSPRGRGRASACRIHVLGLRSDRNCSAETTNCPACMACCAAWYNYDVCKKADPSYAHSNRSVCEGGCIGDKNC